MQTTVFKTQQLLRSAQHPLRNYIKVLQKDSLSDNVKKSEYAVRGKIPMRGEEIQTELNNGVGNYPFTATTSLNIGNPQAVGQGHLSFNREVLACLIHPMLLKTDAITKDGKNRALLYKSKLDTPMGAYTSNSKGYAYAREKIAEFIKKRDNVPHCDPKDIYITNGAGEGVKLVFSMLIRGKNDGIMIPIPQYPLYSALITLNGGTQISYFLDEQQNWALDTNDVKKKIADSKKAGIDIRCVVIINPGNPTG